MQKIYYTSFSTPIGRICLSATEKGICRVSFGWSKPRGTFSAPLRQAQGDKPVILGGNLMKNDAHFTAIKNDILKYLSGKPVSFNKYPVELLGTDFQKKVWHVLSDIPYGEVLTYKQVAERVGMPMAFRAVGMACAKNKLPIIIPCHRVIAGSGLGGFSGGVKLKRHLLKLEDSNRLDYGL